MKQTTNDNYATKQDLFALEERLEDRLDQKFTKRLLESHNALRTELKHDSSLLRAELMTSISVFSNRIITAIDPLIKDMETRQQERELAAQQFNQLKRIVTKLENT